MEVELDGKLSFSWGPLLPLLETQGLVGEAKRSCCVQHPGVREGVGPVSAAESGELQQVDGPGLSLGPQVRFPALWTGLSCPSRPLVLLCLDSYVFVYLGEMRRGFTQGPPPPSASLGHSQLPAQG